MMGMKPTHAKFNQALALLREPEAPFTADMIRSLSDLSGADLHDFSTLWPSLLPLRRRDLITRLVETAETNFEFDFGPIILLALDDPDEEVRRLALDGIFEDSPPTVIERVIGLAKSDPFSEVRAAATQTLGQFILQGELGKLPDHLNTRLQDTVLALYNNMNEALDVRRRALEAIANCGREGVKDMIREAYFADDLPMRVSAVFAMGRTCDDAWASHVLDELDSEEPEMVYEAARAAGELELKKALPRLIEMAYEDDREVQEMAIWALGEIGGKQARNALNELAALAEENGDDELSDAVQEAQSVASMVGEDLIPMFDFDDLDSDLDDDYDEDFDLYYDDEYDDEDADLDPEDALDGDTI